MTPILGQLLHLPSWIFPIHTHREFLKLLDRVANKQIVHGQMRHVVSIVKACEFQACSASANI